MAISLIAALDENFAIGRNGRLPWHLPDDLRWFKRLTTGRRVLMGYNTSLSIGRVLPGRGGADGRGDDVAPSGAQRDALHRQVVGLGGAGGEDDAAGRAAHQPGDLGPGAVE